MSFRSVLVVTVMLTVSCSADQNSDDAKVATEALLREFEAVAFADASLLRHNAAWFDTTSSRALVALPFDYLRRALDAFKPNGFETLLQHATVVLAGAEGFKPPSGLGLVPATRCFVLVLSSAAGADQLLERPSDGVIDGAAVWHWSAAIGEFGDRDSRVSNLSLTRVGRSWLTMCNDADKLQLTLNALKDPAPNWSYGMGRLGVAANHDVWIRRRFRRPSEHPMAAGLSDLRENAETISFFTDKNSATGIVHLTSSAPATTSPYKRRAQEILPEFVQLDSRTWKLEILLDSSPSAHEAMFGIMGLLGFVVYL